MLYFKDQLYYNFHDLITLYWRLKFKKILLNHSVQFQHIIM